MVRSQVFLRPSCVIWRGEHKYTIHARRDHYGRPRYDIVELLSEQPQPWYGRILAIFDVRNPGAGTYRTLALIWWLHTIGVSHVVGATTFRYYGQYAEVIDVDTIVKPIRMLTSPRRIPGAAAPLCFVLLPYGKANERR